MKPTLRAPNPDPDYPVWLEHLRAEHVDLFWVARALKNYYDRNLRWPTRNELFARVSSRYDNAHEMEQALDTLNAAWDVREDVGCDLRCGHPIYRFEVKNRRGPASIVYGLTPFPQVVDVWVAPGAHRGALEHFPVPELEVRVWNSAVANSRTVDPLWEPDRDVARAVKHLAIKEAGGA